MATAPGGKIVLKTSTKMSLNERFTAYRQQAQTNNMSTMRQRMQNQQQASLKNRRLAQQMANRPSVIAALKLKKRSLKQRLGQTGNGGGPLNTNVKSRLTLGGRQTTRSLKGRLGGHSPRQGRGKGYVSIRGGIRRMRGGGTGGARPGMSPMLKGRLGIPVNTSNRNRQGSNQNSINKGQGRSPRRGGFGRGRGGFNRNFRSQRGNFGGQALRKGGRGAGSNRRGRGRRSGRANANRGKSIPSKQELDNQLDEYMAKTKTHLDAELDAYMAETSNVIS